MKNIKKTIFILLFASLSFLPIFVLAKIYDVYRPSVSNITNTSATVSGSVRYSDENKDIETYFAYEEVPSGIKNCASLLLKTPKVKHYSTGGYGSTSFSSIESLINLSPNTRYLVCLVAIETDNSGYGLPKVETIYSSVNVFSTLYKSGSGGSSGLTTMPVGQIGDTYAVLGGSIILPQPNPPRFKTSFYLFKHENGKNYSCSTIANLTLSGRNPIYGPKGVAVELVDVYGDGNFTRTARFLEPGTTYDYCAYSQEANAVVNTKRTSGGIIITTITPPQRLANNVLSFTTTGGSSGTSGGSGRKSQRGGNTAVRPDLIGNVTTLPIQNTTDIEAMLVGNVDRAGNPSYGYFRFSTAKKPPIFCNDIYGSNMRSITATNTALGQHNNERKSGKINAGNFYGLATGLRPNTEYYYCAIVSNNATNPTEIEYGKVLKFKTKPCPTCDKTDVVTDVATNISYDSARVHGSYFSNEDIETYFEYRENDPISVLVPNPSSTVSKNNWIETGEKIKHKENTYGKIHANIDGLKSETLYSFRAVGKTTNPNKIYYGDILTFQTHSDPNTHGYEIEDTGTETTGTGGETGTGTGNDVDNDGEDNDIDDNDGIDDDEDGYDNDDENDEDIDDDGENDETDDNDGADNDGDGSDTDDDDIDNDGEDDENDDNDGIDNDGDGNDEDDNDRDNDGEPDSEDDNDGIDTDGDGNDRDTSDHDNDGEPDSDDDNDGLDTDGDGKDADDSDRDNDGEPDSEDDNDNFDSDRDGSDQDDSDRDNDGEKDKDDDDDGFDHDGDGSDNDGDGNNSKTGKKVGQIGTPKPDAIVRYTEGVEHVLFRQIKANSILGTNYTQVYDDGTDNYEWNMAHQMAIDFSYVDPNTGLEIRVSQPDVSAYEIEQIEDRLYVYEYHLEANGIWRIIDVRETTTVFKEKNPFEYYFKKVRKFFGF